MNNENKIITHYTQFFAEHEYEVIEPSFEQLNGIAPFFKVVKFKPCESFGLWIYCTVGASSIERDDSPLHEYLLISPIETDRAEELLAMVTYFHSKNSFSFGHTSPIGDSWLENSLCDHWLVSLPHLFGKELEILPLTDSHAHVAWLVPITELERNYKISSGLDALEDKFEDLELEFWNVQRNSLV